jgi:hypothetical protein
MATELVLDASVSLAWFLKETPERATYAATVNAAAVHTCLTRPESYRQIWCTES